MRIFYNMLWVVNITCIYWRKMLLNNCLWKTLAPTSRLLWLLVNLSVMENGYCPIIMVKIPWNSMMQFSVITMKEHRTILFTKGGDFVLPKNVPDAPTEGQTISYKQNFLCCKQPHVSLNYLFITKYFGTCMHTRLKHIYIELLPDWSSPKLVYKKRNNITICWQRCY